MPTEVFTIKPLAWEPIASSPRCGERSEPLRAKVVYEVSRIHYKHRGDVYGDWRLYLADGGRHDVDSPEEGKRLAEEHWQSYVKQALVLVEGNHAD